MSLLLGPGELPSKHGGCGDGGTGETRLFDALRWDWGEIERALDRPEAWGRRPQLVGFLVVSCALIVVEGGMRVCPVYPAHGLPDQDEAPLREISGSTLFQKTPDLKH